MANAMTEAQRMELWDRRLYMAYRAGRKAFDAGTTICPFQREDMAEEWTDGFYAAQVQGRLLAGNLQHPENRG